MLPHPKKILDIHGISAKQSLGQNFLSDAGILARIANAAELTSEDTVVEVGPGLGHLTVTLAERAGKVITIELDDRLLPVLYNVIAPHEHITLVHGDILQTDWMRYVTTPTYKVVANVPYYITGAILRRFLEAPQPPASLVTTVQKEVATRLAAIPGKMSLLAVSVQFFGEVTTVMPVKAGAFWPRPTVDSAVIKVDCTQRSPWDVPSKLFFRVAKMGFSQKRKMLKNNLRGLGLDKTVIAAALQTAGIPLTHRPQMLSIAQWVALTQQLYPPDTTPS